MGTQSALAVPQLGPLLRYWRQEAAATAVIQQPSHRHSGPETTVAATVRLLGWESYPFDDRWRLDKRGHLQALVMEVNGKIKRTVSDVPSCDQAIFDP